MSSRLAAILLAAGVAGTLIGCGSDPSSQVPATHRAVTKTVELKPDTTQPADPQRFRDATGWYFTTPSGRYACGIVEKGAGCQGPTKPLPADMADCRAEPGEPAIEVTDTAHFRCLTESTYTGPNRHILAYGATLTVNGYTCTSARNGVTCRNDRTGHGFRIARSTNELF
ncbi:DUF6636 domain-containing protein [Nocardia arthritidis]|uniref:Uncharacterized protein n=1 Tax=Nocardia arthritidis TaxID=228602 RepID=A0A6G9YF03_9NOCA|nr:DUF6636 domain-containing protein [Nocardia arthritidis]QIS11768.1 hypothetical protein F5544_19500 [Nocardia arthritidis]